MTKQSASQQFSHAVKVFSWAFGNTPPARVFELHPAHEPLREAIKASVRKKFQGRKSLLDIWASEAATHILRDFVALQGKVTDAGASADDLKSDLAAYGKPIHGSLGLNRALDEIAANLIDDEPPSGNEPLMQAWQAVRDCPPPDISLMREDAPTWGMDWEQE